VEFNVDMRWLIDEAMNEYETNGFPDGILMVVPMTNYDVNIFGLGSTFH